MHDDDDSKGKSLFQHPAHLSLTLLVFTSFFITLLFLDRLNEMATDKGSLASELDGHSIKLLTKVHYTFAHSFPPLSPILLHS
jgi:hypothetical protein